MDDIVNCFNVNLILDYLCFTTDIHFFMKKISVIQNKFIFNNRQKNLKFNFFLK